MSPSRTLPTALFAAALAILTAQAALTYGLRREEYLPRVPKLESFPSELTSWTRTQVLPIEPEVWKALGPQDVLNQVYRESGTRYPVNLFIAYYGSTAGSKKAHSPKNCLPGAGWQPASAEIRELRAGSTVIPVNDYVIERGAEQNVVLYWFQTYQRAFAREEALSVYRLFHTVSDHRTDLAFVRIVVPVYRRDVATAQKKAMDFAQSMAPALDPYFPAGPRR